MIEKTRKKAPVKSAKKTGRVKAVRPHRNRTMVKLTRSDWFTILWIIVFFPIGLTRMWKNSCRWNNTLKCAISGLCVMAIAAIFIVPSPYRELKGGIEIVSEDAEVEIFGPAAPGAMMDGYTSTAQESVVIDSVAETSTTVTVYAADGAECYHLGDCKFAFASAKRLTVYEAYFLGYRPCGACKPPVYDPVTGKTTENAAVVTETENVPQESVFADGNSATDLPADENLNDAI